jgi:alpha-beta hydrolase superfamily lysophospholipase
MIMRALPLPPLFPLACLSLLLLGGAERLSAADSKRIHFATFDEVELSGSFYPAAPAAGKRAKDAVVLLLHDFQHLKGGGSKDDGWIQLANQLQEDGYAVLSFDFRGFGNSRTVSPNFWKHPHNQSGIRGSSKRNPPATIDQKNFTQAYYLTLINDISAARAYLNTMNDAGDVNTSNVIVVGAGQGATLGALWVASECRRQRDPRSDRLLEGQLPNWQFLPKFDDPEGNDIAAAVWVSISPSLEGKLVGTQLRTALVDAARTAKIPTYFLYGKSDSKAADLATNYLNAITTENGKKMEQKFVQGKAVAGTGELSGSRMFGKGRKTGEYITDYLDRVLEDRGNRVRRTREEHKFAFCWSMPWPTAKGAVDHVLAKLPGEAVPHMIPPRILGFR